MTLSCMGTGEFLHQSVNTDAPGQVGPHGLNEWAGLHGQDETLEWTGLNEWDEVNVWVG